MSDKPIKHDTAAGRFETVVDGHTAHLDYELEDGVMRFTHTIVPDAIGGRGIAGRLVRHGMEHAREHGLHIVPQCSYVRAWLERHPDYRDLALT